MATFLKEGDKAPAFKAKDQNGRIVSLADYKGQKIAVYFYPEDDTPTCTIQACNLRDNFGLLQQHDIALVGISPDSSASHKKFAAKFNLPFTMVEDESKKIIDAYGVWGPKQLYGRHYEGLHRTTFLIDEKGIIRKIFLKPRNKAHAEEIVKWAELINQK